VAVYYSKQKFCVHNYQNSMSAIEPAEGLRDLSQRIQELERERAVISRKPNYTEDDHRNLARINDTITVYQGIMEVFQVQQRAYENRHQLQRLRNNVEFRDPQFLQPTTPNATHSNSNSQRPGLYAMLQASRQQRPQRRS
jgi:hypothetical protein